MLAKRHLTESLGGFIERRYKVGDDEEYCEVGEAHDLWETAIASGKPVIIAVHGTGDGSHEARLVPTRPRWWQIGSKFSVDVSNQVFSGEATWLPFHWHGANSDTKRHEGAKGFAQLCGALSDRKIPYVVIGHSHGGNVIERAFRIYSANVGKVRFCKAIVTLGAPYFKTKAKLGWLFQHASKLFGALVALVSIIFLIISFFIVADMIPGFFELIIIIFFMVISGVLFIYLLNGVVETVHYNFLNKKNLQNISFHWNSMHYFKDEVINLLPIAANPEIKFSSKLAEENLFLRTGLSIGRLLNIIMSLLASSIVTIILYYLIHDTLALYEISNIKPCLDGMAFLGLMIFAILLPSLSLVITYLTIILISFVLNPVLSSLFAGAVANFKDGFVKNTLRNLAYGEDHDFKLLGISPTPQHFHTRLDVIETDYSEQVSNENFSQFKHKAYGLMSSVSEAAAYADTEALVANLMRAIYHNAYFQDDEVISLVCERINATMTD
jgi:hypothetical protein